MAYADLATVQATDPGSILTAAWCDQVRDNEEFFIAPPSCHVYNSAAVSVNNATDTQLGADSERWDTNAMHSTVSVTSRITMQTAGKHRLVSNVAFAADVDGRRLCAFLINGTTTFGGTQLQAVTTGNSTVVSFEDTYEFAAGDYVEIRVHHTAGAALNVTLVEFSAEFEGR
jgi:hypothetical protein